MIRFVVFDFDGVFTNGECHFANGQIMKSYNVKDGAALSLLRHANIRTGLISGYNSNKEVIWNGNNPVEEVANHLKFDNVSIGQNDKMKILERWLHDYNITENEVAYIGDDLADIEILKSVGMSACPQDAILECKNIVDYVCQKKGGEGCVREFVDLLLAPNRSRVGEIMVEIQKEIIFQFDQMNEDDIVSAASIIRGCSGNIYFTGIGKSKNAAIECCNLLKSISIQCFVLDAVESMHGDIGTIRSVDVVFLFSKSGNTLELVELIQVLEFRGCTTIGVCCDPDSKFMQSCTHTYQLPFGKEVSGNIDKLPTNSYISQIIFVNILASILKDDIDIAEYKNNHLAGSIGKKLETLRKRMKTYYPYFVINDKDILLHEIALSMTQYKMGCAFFTDINDKFLGILTDGDIRRLLLKNDHIKYITINDINQNYYYETDLNKYASECKKISHIPILREDKLIGVCDMTN